MNLNPLRNPFSSTKPAASAEEDSDFGFGSKVGRKPGTRLINNDGSFNITRKGKRDWAPFQSLVQMSWSRLLLVTIVTYILLNCLFTLGFLVIGTDSLSNIDQGIPFGERALSAFFFSVQTFTTVGYGTIAPVGVAANALSALVALFGWIGLAIVTGLFYGRFARPSKMILFSEHALITNYKGGIKSLQFRIVNKRDTHLINVSTRVVLTWLEDSRRRFAPLALERDFVSLFPLNWTIVHPIDADSPIYGWTQEEYRHRHAELLITIDGYDETYAQVVHDQNSYIHPEIRWNARFQPMYIEREATTELWLDRIHALEDEEE